MAGTVELDSFFGVRRRKEQTTALLAKINRPTTGATVRCEDGVCRGAFGFLASGEALRAERARAAAASQLFVLSLSPLEHPIPPAPTAGPAPARAAKWRQTPARGVGEAEDLAAGRPKRVGAERVRPSSIHCALSSYPSRPLSLPFFPSPLSLSPSQEAEVAARNLTAFVFRRVRERAFWGGGTLRTPPMTPRRAALGRVPAGLAGAASTARTAARAGLEADLAPLSVLPGSAVDPIAAALGAARPPTMPGLPDKPCDNAWAARAAAAAPKVVAAPNPPAAEAAAACPPPSARPGAPFLARPTPTVKPNRPRLPWDTEWPAEEEVVVVAAAAVEETVVVGVAPPAAAAAAASAPPLTCPTPTTPAAPAGAAAIVSATAALSEDREVMGINSPLPHTESGAAAWAASTNKRVAAAAEKKAAKAAAAVAKAGAASQAKAEVEAKAAAKLAAKAEAVRQAAAAKAEAVRQAAAAKAEAVRLAAAAKAAAAAAAATAKAAAKVAAEAATAKKAGKAPAAAAGSYPPPAPDLAPTITTEGEEATAGPSVVPAGAVPAGLGGSVGSPARGHRRSLSAALVGALVGGGGAGAGASGSGTAAPAPAPAPAVGARGSWPTVEVGDEEVDAVAAAEEEIQAAPEPLPTAAPTLPPLPPSLSRTASRAAAAQAKADATAARARAATEAKASALRAKAEAAASKKRAAAEAAEARAQAAAVAAAGRAARGSLLGRVLASDEPSLFSAARHARRESATAAAKAAVATAAAALAGGGRAPSSAAAASAAAIAAAARAAPRRSLFGAVLASDRPSLLAAVRDARTASAAAEAAAIEAAAAALAASLSEGGEAAAEAEGEDAFVEATDAPATDVVSPNALKGGPSLAVAVAVDASPRGPLAVVAK